MPEMPQCGTSTTGWGNTPGAVPEPGRSVGHGPERGRDLRGLSRRTDPVPAVWPHHSTPGPTTSTPHVPPDPASLPGGCRRHFGASVAGSEQELQSIPAPASPLPLLLLLRQSPAGHRRLLRWRPAGTVTLRPSLRPPDRWGSGWAEQLCTPGLGSWGCCDNRPVVGDTPGGWPGDTQGCPSAQGISCGSGGDRFHPSVHSTSSILPSSCPGLLLGPVLCAGSPTTRLGTPEGARGTWGRWQSWVAVCVLVTALAVSVREGEGFSAEITQNRARVPGHQRQDGESEEGDLGCPGSEGSSAAPVDVASPAGSALNPSLLPPSWRGTSPAELEDAASSCGRAGGVLWQSQGEQGSSVLVPGVTAARCRQPSLLRPLSPPAPEPRHKVGTSHACGIGWETQLLGTSASRFGPARREALTTTAGAPGSCAHRPDTGNAGPRDGRTEPG
ncbi:uncharacterized protein LOC141731345 [Zonotrichia albicollis]|uniref:uncharacterized protein LOC141731345 n=1 Tax=Zonotrichia albicollis TaxID=44394 RepID=UPI003D80B17B